jgi:hypothetical protein
MTADLRHPVLLVGRVEMLAGATKRVPNRSRSVTRMIEAPTSVALMVDWSFLYAPIQLSGARGDRPALSRICRLS